MEEQDLYLELLAWLRSRHPLVLAQWERDRPRLASQEAGDRRLLQAPSSLSRSSLDQLSADANATEIIKAMRAELESLGISGGTPGFTPDGTPCVHLLKKGVYGKAYEEDVTVARLRDTGYRRHLKQVFG